VIEIRANRDLDPMIQNEFVRRMAVLHMKTEAPFRKGSPDHVGHNRPPSKDEESELLEFARKNDLFGKFDVVTDRVFNERISAGGMYDLTERTERTERTEFYLFRRRDVPYLMSLKTAMEVMET
jgi:hypothetical protein